jgi:hypothetical protein
MILIPLCSTENGHAADELFTLNSPATVDRIRLAVDDDAAKKVGSFCNLLLLCLVSLPAGAEGQSRGPSLECQRVGRTICGVEILSV